MKYTIALLIAVFFWFSGFSQDIVLDDPIDTAVIDTSLKAKVSAGMELQAYPTGFIPGLIIDATFNNANALTLRLGYNWFNHRNLGVHDSEKGYGFGFSLGYRRYFEEQGLKGFFIGLRADWWFSSVDWSEHVNDDRDQAELLKSTSDIIVFQPVGEVGYKVKFKNNKASFTPMIGLGYETNISTQGEIIPPGIDYPSSVNKSEDTGEGFIVIAGIAFTFEISRDD